MTVVNLSLKLLIFIAVGFCCRKLRVFADGFDKMLSKFVLAVPIPCMIIKSFNVEFSIDQLLDCPVVLGLSLVSMAVCFVVGHLVYLKTGRSDVGKAARFGLMFTNFTFFGMPVVEELYGSQGIFYYVIFTLPIRVVFYGMAPILLGARGEKTDWNLVLRQCFCPPVIAVFIGVFFYVLQIQLPGVLNDALVSIGNIASPLGLMLCGTIIADADWRGVLKKPAVLWTTLARLLLMPAVVLGVMLLMRIDKMIINSVIFFFAMPMASLQPMYYLRYNPDSVEGREVSGFMVILSTFLCIFTIPIWATIMQHI